MDTSDAAKALTEEELQAYKILSSPVRWAEATLRNPRKPSEPLVLRDYQRRILKSKSRMKVVRMGRRMGKTVTLCTEILWSGYTSEHIQILVVAPYKSQVEVIFSTMGRLIGDAADLKDSIDKFKTNPFYIRFFNGAEIRGFTAGTKSGQKGASIRGQSADKIYLDEVDYMGDEAITAVTAILSDTPTTTLWGSSTPTGKRESFWKWCTDDTLGFEKHHYRSSDRPDWTDELENFYRRTTTEMEYLHEYDAEFGEEVVGVFSHAHIDDCLHKYAYAEDAEVYAETVDKKTGKAKKEIHHAIIDQWNPRNTYIMGVDWNSEAHGVQIVVVEQILEAPEKQAWMTGKFRVFYTEGVSSTKGFTQTKAVDRVKQLVKMFGISYVYVDQGYGSMQIESLRKEGLEDPSSRLDKIVVPVDFASKATIIEPATKRLVEKPMKPFMVNNAVLFLEQHLLILPEIEDEQKRLVGQMRGYTVERRSSVTGAPVYSSGNDHVLDAFMLCLLGYTMERSEMGHLTPATTVRSSMDAIKGILKRVDDRWDLGNDRGALQGVQQRQPMLMDVIARNGLPGTYTTNSAQGKYDSLDYKPVVSPIQKGMRSIPSRTSALGSHTYPRSSGGSYRRRNI